LDHLDAREPYVTLGAFTLPEPIGGGKMRYGVGIIAGFSRLSAGRQFPVKFRVPVLGDQQD